MKSVVMATTSQELHVSPIITPLPSPAWTSLVHRLSTDGVVFIPAGENGLLEPRLELDNDELYLLLCLFMRSECGPKTEGWKCLFATYQANR